MGGGGIPPGLPVANPTTSYWQLPPHRLAHHRTTPELPTSQTFDYIIIGSGISGAAIAYKLLCRDPGVSVLMLEARTAASGASGRNGGHCRGGCWLNYREYLDAFGEDEALKIMKLEEENIADIAAFVREHHIRCDFTDVETADVYMTEREWGKLLEVVRIEAEVRVRRPNDAPKTPRTIWEGEAARERFKIPAAVGGVTYQAHTQNPYLLVCKMLELCLDKGLNLQTNTAALEIASKKSSEEGVGEEAGHIHNHNHNQGWNVETTRGIVHSKQLILATNAYTNFLYAELAETSFLWAHRRQIAAIRPGSKIDGSPALRTSVGLNDAAVGHGDYFHSRARGHRGSGDIIYGGGDGIVSSPRNVTDDSAVDEKVAAYLAHAAPRYFGSENWGHEGGHVMDWSGITCYTPDTLPLVGGAPGRRGLWASVGMNGHGMALAFRCAEGLVSMITTGEEPDWFPKPLRLERAWSASAVRIPQPMSIPPSV